MPCSSCSSCSNCSSCGSSSSCDSTVCVSNDKEIIIKNCCDSSSSGKNCKSSKPCCFKTTLSNLTDLSPNPVTFKYTIDNSGTVVLQWEKFSGTIKVNGLPYIYVCQSIPYTPAKPVTQTTPRTYNGTGGYSYVEVSSDSEQLKFYIQPSKSGESVESNDSVVFEGSSITWIS